MRVAILLAAMLGAAWLQAPPATVDFEVMTLQRRDLPDDFPFQLLDVGFAVLELRVTNTGDEIASLDPASVEAFEKQGKPLENAEMTEIVPKLIGFYQGSRPGIHGQGGTGYPGYGRVPGRRTVTVNPTIAAPSQVGSISVGLAKELRGKLEAYQLNARQLEPGTSTQGFIYLKSKKRGRQLLTGFVRIGALTRPILAK